MRAWGCMLLVGSIFVLGLAVPDRAKAMINAGGGWWCAGYSTVWVDWPGGGGGLTLTLTGCGYEGGGGSGGGGASDPEDPDPPHGSGGAPTPSVPDMACVSEAAEHGGMPKKYSTSKSDSWAFVDDSVDPSKYQYSSVSSTPPAGYKTLNGFTLVRTVNGIDDGSYTKLYRAGYSSRSATYSLEYIVPGTNQVKTLHGPISAAQMSVLALAHEYAHQNSVTGSTKAETEKRANGYGVKALEHYNASGSPCG